MVRQGMILRAQSGFYDVCSGPDRIRCQARGRFRKEGITPLVGDCVVVEADADRGTITEILPRKNAFARPAVANIDSLVMVVSAAVPVTDPYLIDRVTVRCEKSRCEVMLAVNKCDLDPAGELREIYRNTGYRLFPVSAATGEGVDGLRQALAGKVCCFTGNSGVGKSSLLNALDTDLSLPTGEISRKLSRGKHTTRHVELFSLGAGTLAGDTPGFSSFGEDLQALRPEELAGLFPEFRPYLGQCRFDDCTHRSEPGCAVRQAVPGMIHTSRYTSYLRLYAELSKRPRWESC